MPLLQAAGAACVGKALSQTVAARAELHTAAEHSPIAVAQREMPLLHTAAVRAARTGMLEM